MTGNPRVLISLLMLTGYVAIVPLAGFFVGTGLYLAAHMAFLGIRPLWLVAAVVAGALVFLYLIFIQFLGVPVPHGALY